MSHDSAHRPDKVSPRSRPLDTTARITTLSRYGRLDSLSDAQLSQLLGIAAEACGEGARAMLAILDDRRGWFDVVVGLERAEAQALLPLCAFALLRDELEVIPDLRLHDQLRVEPSVVRDGGPRFAALAKVPDDDGAPAAVFCVVAPSPRTLTDAQARLLSAVVDQIGAAISMRVNLRALRQTHQRHLEALQLLRGVMRAASSLAIVATDLRGVITSFSFGAERLLGVLAAEVLERATPEPFFDLAAAIGPLSDRAVPRDTVTSVPHIGHTEVGARLATLADAESAGARDAVAKRSDGLVVPVSLVVTPTRDEAGAATGYVLIAQDIRERLAADGMKQDFISMVSHEMRTPLTSIRGALGLLLGGVVGALPPEVEELVRIADSNGGRLVGLINDMLDVHKMESGDVELQIVAADLGEVVEESVGLNAPFGEGLGVRFRYERPSAPVAVLADAGRIAQVVTNLLSNAAKFSSSGSEVEVAIAHTDGGARVEVRDRGPGIPDEYRDRIFGKFVQVEGRQERAKGTGLGLSIVRTIVERHGGRVGFSPREGGGTVFWFELPHPDAMERNPTVPLD